MKKKKMIGLAVIAIIIIGIGGLVLGINILKDKKIDKLLSTSTTYINNKEYDKALATLDMILSETDNEKASKEKELINDYLNAKKAYDSKNYNEALNDINKMGDISDYKGLDEDVNSLKTKVETNIKQENEINQSIENIKTLIDKKDYNSAKKAINSIDKNKLNDRCKEEVSKLESIVDENIKKAEEEEIKKQKDNAEKEKKAKATKQEEFENSIPETTSPTFGQGTPWKNGYTQYKTIILPLPNGNPMQVNDILDQICSLPTNEAFQILKNYGWSDGEAMRVIGEHKNGVIN